jgi:hypothetical protein
LTAVRTRTEVRPAYGDRCPAMRTTVDEVCGLRENPLRHEGDEERCKAASPPPSEARGRKGRVYLNLCEVECGMNTVKGASERRVTDAYVSRLSPNCRGMGVVARVANRDAPVGVNGHIHWLSST